MDEALELQDFLPVSYRTQSEAEYVAFLWDAFQSNYATGKFEFASLAFHLLYMSFVSFSIWQIRIVRVADFRNALVGFQNDAESSLLEADNPFKFYERLKESQIFRFLKLIGCNNEQVGEFAKFVKRRNKIAHPSGTVFFNDPVSIDGEISEMIREVRNIEEHMRPVVVDVYKNFLVDSASQEELEYDTMNQEIEINLIHRYYMSLKDLEICCGFDIQTMQAHPNFPVLSRLHGSLGELYAEY